MAASSNVLSYTCVPIESSDVFEENSVFSYSSIDKVCVEEYRVCIDEFPQRAFYTLEKFAPGSYDSLDMMAQAVAKKTSALLLAERPKKVTFFWGTGGYETKLKISQKRLFLVSNIDPKAIDEKILASAEELQKHITNYVTGELVLEKNPADGHSFVSRVNFPRKWVGDCHRICLYPSPINSQTGACLLLIRERFGKHLDKNLFLERDIPLNALGERLRFYASYDDIRVAFDEEGNPSAATMIKTLAHWKLQGEKNGFMQMCVGHQISDRERGKLILRVPPHFPEKISFLPERNLQLPTKARVVAFHSQALHFQMTVEKAKKMLEDFALTKVIVGKHLSVYLKPSEAKVSFCEFQDPDLDRYVRQLCEKQAKKTIGPANVRFWIYHLQKPFVKLGRMINAQHKKLPPTYNEPVADKFSWAVTLIRYNLHAEIVIEGIMKESFLCGRKGFKKDKPFMCLLHFGKPIPPNLKKDQECSTKESNFAITPITDDELIFRDKTQTWYCSSDRILSVIGDLIKKTNNGTLPQLHLLGSSSIFLSKKKGQENCITFALKVLSLFGIKLPKGVFEKKLVALPSLIIQSIRNKHRFNVHGKAFANGRSAND